MYLEELYLENTGPISKCHVKPLFDDNGNPLPVVIVGPNGSGKSIFLSYIVDALTEFAKQAFDDIVPSDGLSEPYFRFISSSAIRSGKSFSLSLLHFKANDEDLYYCEKAGMLNPKDYSPNVKSMFSSVWKWRKDENYKDVSVNKNTVETEMQNGAYAFFPASRHEDPIWLNPKSLKIKFNPFSLRFNQQLDKPLRVETGAEENISWILSVLLDAAVDFDIIQQLQAGATLSNVEERAWKNASALQRSKQNIEHILRAILQDKHAKLLRDL